MPTATLEEYIEAIYKLSEEGLVRPGQIAEAMNVSAPTVTATLRRLVAAGLVRRSRGSVELTPEGSREALSILRRHRLAERLLVDVLGLPWEDVHEDACLLEHSLSPRVQEALERFLDNPEHCPHGHPIPSADLAYVESTGVPLASLRVGDVGEVVSVDERPEGALAAAADTGIMPGESITVCQVREDGGSMTVQVSGRRREIDRSLAQGISVRQLEAMPFDG